MTPAAAFWGVFWPALASLIVLLIGLALRRWRFAGQAAGAAAIAAGFIVAELHIRGIPRAFPADATRWLPHIALAIGAVGILRALGGKTLWGMLIAGAVVVGSAVILLRPGLQAQVDTARAAATLTLASIIVASIYIAGHHAGRASDVWRTPLLLAILCMGGGVALAQSFFASLGQVLTGLGGALIPIAIMATSWSRMGATNGALPVAASLFALCIMTAGLYSSLPTPSMFFLLSGLLVPLALRLPRLRRLPLLATTMIGFLAVSILVAAAIWLSPMRFDFSV